MNREFFYMAADGRPVDLEILEEVCIEMGGVIQGSILNLRDVLPHDGLGEDQCARLFLALTALGQAKSQLDRIFPIS